MIGRTDGNLNYVAPCYNATSRYDRKEKLAPAGGVCVCVGGGGGGGGGGANSFLFTITFQKGGNVT